MAEGQKSTAGNTAVPHEGDHDRVVMLSLHADGSVAQHNPEIIGNKEFALAATKEQFAQQAVSAKDVELRGVSSGAVTIVGTPDGQPDKEVPATTGEDPTVKKLTEAHEAAQKSAESAAEKAVGDLFKGA